MTKTMMAATGLLIGMAVGCGTAVLASNKKDVKKLVKKTANAMNAVGDKVEDSMRCLRH